MRSALIALAFLTFGALAIAQEKDLSGTWTGDWSGGSASGPFHMTIRSEAEGNAKLEVTFSFAGEDVRTTVKSVKIDGPKITATYEFDLQGNTLQSTIMGERSGDTLSGKYETKSVSDGSSVDEGTWKTSK